MTETNTGPPPPPPPPHRRLSAPPMITLPPQPSLENLLLSTGTGQIPGFSPGPMTMVSSFFSDHSPDVDFRSFSQLLAGAIASPVSPSPVFLNTSKHLDDKKSGGFKQNKPADLVFAQSPSGFMFPSVFSPSGFLNSPGFFSPLQSPFGMSHQQALAHVTAQAALSQSYFNNVQPENGSFVGAAAVVTEGEQQMVNAINAKPEVEDSQVGSPDGFQVSQSDVTEPHQVVSVSSDAKDGYNWRKYGQKQVKASEHPRSYYKCTHVNCPVKKKVGMSLDGHVTDIVYKGQHNHEPPQPGKRGKDSADANKPNNSQFVKRVVEQPVADQGSNHMIRSDQGHNQIMRTDQGSNQLMRIDEPDDEPNPKRRNTEVGPVSVPVDSTSAHKMVSESKIVVQTRSEVDLLDDGFKWRKYGQKVVKGNTNPRSYYKCTYAGCNVRKHVERAPSDPKSVVTTYEGKHNHDIPVARHRGYNNNNSGGQMGKSTRPSQRKDTNLGNNERPVLLQMKEEEITA